jgi:tetraacyldisaccharide 4'-kinase
LILTAASSIYGAAARWRRHWYAHDPARRKRLAQAVISVGNLSTGGSGKTPIVRELARLLAARGERPAVLSRGYGRRHAADGVTVVSDGTRILADVDHAGDEPLMLAEADPAVPVLVGADRYLSGSLAEQRFGVTVHILDDGFQHLALARDVDLLLVAESDLDDGVLPAGRLRERVESAADAHAILIPAASSAAATDRLQRTCRVSTVFTVHRSLGVPVWLRDGRPADLPVGAPVFGAAGIARPQRFFDDLASSGWTVVGTMSFRDHHRFTAADVSRMTHAARAAGATAVMTTEKDAVRLDRRMPSDPPIVRVPLIVRIEPPAFVDWLFERLRDARARSGPGRNQSA